MNLRPDGVAAKTMGMNKEVRSMFILCLAVLVVAAIVIFSVQNAAPVSVAFLAWKFGASLAVIVFLAFVVGIIVAALCSVYLRVKSAARRCRGALRRFVEQFRLGQDAAADRHHGIGGQDISAAQIFVDAAPS